MEAGGALLAAVAIGGVDLDVGACGLHEVEAHGVEHGAQVIRLTDSFCVFALALLHAAEIEAETYRFINGEISSFDKYVVVEGTTATLSEEMSTKMYDWFALNKDWMVQAGVITDTQDSADYLSDTVLEVDVVNSMSETLVFVLAALAAACVLYIIVELVLMATGFYLDGAKKKKEDYEAQDDSDDEEPSDEAETASVTEAAADEDKESSDESEKSEESAEESEKTAKAEAEEDKE